MSSAIVSYPIIFTWAESAGIFAPAVSTATGVTSAGTSVATAATAVSASHLLITAGVAVGGVAAIVIAPIVISSILDTLTSAILMEKPSEECLKKLEKSTGKLRKDMEKTISLFSEKLSKTEFSNHSRKKLEEKLKKIHNLFTQASTKLTRFELSTKDSFDLKSSLKDFSEEIASAEQEYLQVKALFDFYLRKIATLLEEQSKSGFSNEKIKRITRKFEELQKSENPLETRLVDASELISEIEDTKGNQTCRVRNEISFFSEVIEKGGVETVEKSELVKLSSKASNTKSLEVLTAIRDDIKLRAQKMLETKNLSNFFKQQLVAFQEIDFIRKQFGSLIQEALSEKVLPRAKYEELYKRISGRIALEVKEKKEQFVREKISEELAKLNYVVQDSSEEQSLAETISSGKVGVLDTRDSEYKLLLKMNPDQTLAIRLVKVVENENVASDSTEISRQKELEIIHKWCQNVDLFLENLKSHGIFFIEKIRIEEGVDIMTLEQIEQFSGKKRPGHKDQPQNSCRKDQQEKPWEK
ncbi:MAG: hypothetical protein HQM08_13250 [Candidatus Riflebacteria bacterium]|nr:hypothetical protein [Candidatus Riflebacteria bacterium]